MFSLHLKRWGLLLTTLPLLAAWPGNPAQGQEFLRLGESARGLAMGGALTAVADSFDAMFYNPAGLAQSKTSRFELSYWQEESKDSDVTDGGNFFEEADTLAGTTEAEVDSFLQENANKAQSARTQTLAGYHNKTGFGIAYLDTTRLSSPASPTSPPELRLTSDHISGVLMTLAFASEREFIMWGITLKSLERKSSFRILTSADIGNDPDFKSEFGSQGASEFDYDVGFLIRLPIPFFRPTFAATIMNATSPDFNRVTVQSLPKETNIAIAFEPNMFRDYSRLIISAEIRDNSGSAYPDEKANRKRKHLGAELSLLPSGKDEAGRDLYWMHLRIGESQGYSSFGIGFNLADNASIDLVSYAEDVGDANTELRQRRELVQIKLGF